MDDRGGERFADADGPASYAAAGYRPRRDRDGVARCLSGGGYRAVLTDAVAYKHIPQLVGIAIEPRVAHADGAMDRTWVAAHLRDSGRHRIWRR